MEASLTHWAVRSPCSASYNTVNADYVGKTALHLIGHSILHIHTPQGLPILPPYLQYCWVQLSVSLILTHIWCRADPFCTVTSDIPTSLKAFCTITTISLYTGNACQAQTPSASLTIVIGAIGSHRHSLWNVLQARKRARALVLLLVWLSLVA